ncbi:D-alanyl-lipoteichoic acid biosynthesis protein DltD [Enterococcus faecalis]|uniref:D-alanyl-lipoteichoic acid biosynthesis protein DltD n=1 Tax=Enterococcus faecalis TaxID=1351 RepID=UPI0010A69111|nr:D-alanyl-lipoteichoic acid biosynthesis protein DltD [Enterococcus faecalis]
MSRKKRLIRILGPVLCSAVLVAVFFFAPFRINLTSEKTLKEASTSMAPNVLKGNVIKNKAVASGKYVPFFGSSELSRFSAFHPSVLSEKYQRNYRPFLLGEAGTQSLTQAMVIHSMGDAIANKKAVFILSPQWFVKKGVPNDSFGAHYSQLQTFQWLANLTELTSGDQYLAQRLTKFPVVQKDKVLMETLANLQAGQLPQRSQRDYFIMNLRFLNREDELFSQIGMVSREPIVEKDMKQLPATYNFNELDQLAGKIAAKAINNNKFEISNGFYRQRIKPVLPKLAHSQKKWDYRFSPEYGDFQAALEQLAEKNVDVLFVIPPVNKRWSDYTGLSQDMLQQVARKLKYQLQEQGFTNIADFSTCSNERYFMADTIHLGWRGWLAVDRQVDEFMKQPASKKLAYQIDDRFYQTDWQQQNPLVLPQF